MREAARKDKTQKFTNLLHHLTPQLLRASFIQLKKHAAPGVDEMTWRDYAEGIDRRIADLHGRIHRGAYQAQPSKRTYIPKLDGKMRPLAKFGLELHPEKTRLIEFGRYAEERRGRRGEGPPETFDFLGFTHISGKTRGGDFTIHRKTARKKFLAKLRDLKEKLRRIRHATVSQVGSWLQSVLRGWFRYYAVPGNYPRLQQFRDAVQKLWLRLLRRRSQRGRRLTWARFQKVCKRWLPSPKIEHPYPDARFAVDHPR